MGDLESTTWGGETNEPHTMEPDAGYRIEHTESVAADSELAESSERADHGYRDRPMYEFRAERCEEFLDGTSWGPGREIPQFSDPDDLVERINPDFGERSGAFDNNCADSARCFESSWRGQLETAAGQSVEVQPHGGLGAQGELSAETERWAGERFTPVGNPESLRRTLEDVGHGASAIVHTEYVNPNGHLGGHAYNVVNSHGEIRVCDSQTRETLAWDPTSIRPELGPMATHRAMAWDAEGTRVW